MKTFGTLVTVLFVFFALVCLSPAMAQYNYEIYLRPGGSLNGQSINTSNPVINVSPGENLSGTIKIQHIKVHSSDIVPLIYTPNWGNHSTSYNGVAHTSQGTHNFDVSINNLQAPSAPGTYLIIFASAGRYTYGQVAALDACNCDRNNPLFGDGNDIADLTKSDLPIALSEGVGEVRTRDCNTGNYGYGYAGITYVEINVSFSAPVPDIKANGVDESLTISSTENIKITISLASGDREGITSDCWISADTPFGLYWYILESQDWNWKQSDTPILTAQFPLTDVIECPVFDSTLTDGHYTFNFAVDDNADGLFDKTWSDSVELYVVPYECLKPVDDEPLGNKTPLILVHGNNSETKDQYRWGDFIERAGQHSDFAGSYKMYLFRWDSSLSNKLNGLALGCSIDNEEDLHNREVVILAHSRGGIVSRYYMNDYVTQSGGFSGQPGGEHVYYLVTLATPHRGTPGADHIWSIFTFDYNYRGDVAYNLSFAYSLMWDASHLYLLWDDVDNELTDEIVCWNVALLFNIQYCNYLWTNQTDLLALNQQESYLGKIIAYGGNEFDGELSKSEHEKFISKTQEEKKIEAWCEHPSLSYFSGLMADMPVIPNGYPGNPIDDNYRRFQANDGMAPLDSALLLKPGSGNLFHVENGNLVFDEDEVRNHCQVNECHIIENRQTDHLDFLDDDQVIDIVLNRLKTL